MFRYMAVLFHWFDHRAKEHHSSNSVSKIPQQTSCQIPAIGFAGQNKMPIWNIFFDKPELFMAL